MSAYDNRQVMLQIQKAGKQSLGVATLHCLLHINSSKHQRHAPFMVHCILVFVYAEP